MGMTRACPTACSASWFHSRITLADSRDRSSNGSTRGRHFFMSLMVRPPAVCGRMERTPWPARRPSAGAVPGRWGSCAQELGGKDPTGRPLQLHDQCPLSGGSWYTRNDKRVLDRLLLEADHFRK